MKISLPRDPHRMLTEQFGNYMELPAIEERYNHAPEIIEFG